ncbi:YqcC family protein [Vibrio sp. SCSIO 43135]|uniref:YqcC family protein n=1 Tax=Vibrio sp. SCSIO 43135 TaxID=2819096 RepID=UPI002075F5F0|nr:YqcC family protein [Vibrio sp. SCSIO 43135]USD41793.1 YqcC family protein [Vibrio sp. SCSIO 43135]
MTQTESILALLDALQTELSQQNLWQTVPPTDEALASEQPFAIDTLAPHEWLQWIFIAKLHWMHSQNMPLPKGFEVTPYFEQVWQEKPEYRQLLVILNKIDEACA